MATMLSAVTRSSVLAVEVSVMVNSLLVAVPIAAHPPGLVAVTVTTSPTAYPAVVQAFAPATKAFDAPTVAETTPTAAVQAVGPSGSVPWAVQVVVVWTPVPECSRYLPAGQRVQYAATVLDAAAVQNSLILQPVNGDDTQTWSLVKSPSVKMPLEHDVFHAAQVLLVSSAALKVSTAQGVQEEAVSPLLATCLKPLPHLEGPHTLSLLLEPRPLARTP